MKQQDITYQDKLNELRLDISHPNNNGIAFVLLEGKSDVRLFRKLFNPETCKVENIPGGCPKLEECVGVLVSIYPLIIGIRDADFIHLRNESYSKTNMFLTDYHDMEMMLISEDEVFNAFLFEYSSLSLDEHEEARNSIFTTIEQVSLLKWLNEKEHLGYQIEVGFQDLISFNNLDIDFEQYFARVIAKSPNAILVNLSIVMQKLQSLKATNPDPFQICNGHDFVKALSKYVKETGDGRTVKDEIISSSLRMAYTYEHYKMTHLFTSTKSWSDNNNCSIYT
jgi:hypothetical protein